MTRRTEQLKKFGGGATEKNRNIDGSRSTSSYHMVVIPLLNITIKFVARFICDRDRSDILLPSIFTIKIVIHCWSITSSSSSRSRVEITTWLSTFVCTGSFIHPSIATLPSLFAKIDKFKHFLAIKQKSCADFNNDIYDLIDLESGKDISGITFGNGPGKFSVFKIIYSPICRSFRVDHQLIDF